MAKARASKDPWKLPDASGFSAATSRLLARVLGPSLALLGVERAVLPVLLGLQHAVDQRRASESQGGWLRGLILVGALKSGLFVFVMAYLLREIQGKDLLWVFVFSQCFAICTLVLLVFHSDSLVDGDDLRILAPTPVRPRTVYAARCLHMASHTIPYALLCGLFPLALGPVVTKDAWPMVLVPVLIAAAFASALGSVTLLHALTLLLVGARRFADVALGLRVALFAGLVASSQLLQRLGLDSLREAWAAPWRAWVPPLCLADLGPLVRGELGLAASKGALWCLVACFALLPLSILAASRRYLNSLQAPPSMQRHAGGLRERGWLPWLGDRLCPDHAQRAGYGYASALARRERPFLRQALVSSAGLVFGSSFGLILQRDDGVAAVAWIIEAQYASLVFLAILMPTMLDLARFSAHPEARWVHATAPLPNFTSLHRGALLGVACSFCLPLFCGTAAIYVLVAGFEHAVAVIASLGVALVTALWCSPRFVFHLPFSEPFSWHDDSMRNLGAVAPIAAVMVLQMIAVGALYALAPAAEWALLILVALLLPLAWRRFQAIGGPLAAARAPKKAKAAAH